MISGRLIVLTAALLALVLFMAAYVWELRRREALIPATPSTDAMTPPSPTQARSATLWVAYDAPGQLRTQAVPVSADTAPQQRAQEILRALIAIYTAKNSPHMLAAGSEVRDVYLLTSGLAVVDVNAAFADGHTSGVFSEELMVASMVQTLAANVPVAKVKFLVDGKERETLAGHADLSGTYDVQQVTELVRQLAAK